MFYSNYVWKNTTEHIRLHETRWEVFSWKEMTEKAARRACIRMLSKNMRDVSSYSLRDYIRCLWLSFRTSVASRFVRQSSSSLYYVLRAMIFLDIHTCICNVPLHIPCKRLVELSSYNKNQKIAWSFKWLNHLSYSFMTYKSLLYRN